MEDLPQPNNLIHKCAVSIETASTDTEKLAGLFVAAQALKKIDDDNLRHSSKLVLLDSIGPKFLVRLLRSKDSPEYHLFQSVALSILTAFASEKDLVAHPSVLTAVPPVIDVIVERNESEEDQSAILDQAYEFITAIAGNEEGRAKLEHCDALNRILELCISGRLLDRDLNLISSLVHPSSLVKYELYHSLLNKIVSAADEENTQRKFELVSVVDSLLVNCNREALLSAGKTTDWPTKARIVVSSILSSRLGPNQRDPTLKLASTLFGIFGTDWALQPGDVDKTFFLLVTHLSAVEVRMQLEDRSLSDILKNADLVVACFVILEVSLSYVSTDISVLTDDETEQVLKVGQESLASVVQVYKQLDKKSTGKKESAFKLALARVIVAWLAHEANSRLPEVMDILPSVIVMASDSFYAYQSWSESGRTDEKLPVDLMRLLLPGLCNVSTEQGGRKILDDLHTENVLLDCMKFHWKAASGIHPEGCQDDSETALITLCNIFLNLYMGVEAAGEVIGKSDFHSSLLKYVRDILKKFPNTAPLLKGHFIVLGLVLVQRYPRAVEFTELETFFRISINFLKEMYTVEGNHLSVTQSYRANSDQLLELWTLGTTVLSSVIQSIPKVSELVACNRWADYLIDSLLVENIDEAPPNFTQQVESLILSLLNTVPHEKFRNTKTLAACRRHNMKQLGCILFAGEFLA